MIKLGKLDETDLKQLGVVVEKLPKNKSIWAFGWFNSIYLVERSTPALLDLSGLAPASWKYPVKWDELDYKTEEVVSPPDFGR